jgi:hypothetical protein
MGRRQELQPEGGGRQNVDAAVVHDEIIDERPRRPCRVVSNLLPLVKDLR